MNLGEILRRGQEQIQSLSSRSWYPAFQQAYEGGNPDTIKEMVPWLESHPDFDAASGDFVGSSVAQLQHQREKGPLGISRNDWDHVGEAGKALGTAGLAAGAVYGAGLAGGAWGAGAGAVGDAAIAGGVGADALLGGGAEALGGGLSVGSTAGGIGGGGAAGTGLTAGTTASGIGTGAVGTGLAGSTAAGSSLAPGFFASESLYPVIGGVGAASSAGGAGGSDLSGAAAGSSLASNLLRGIPGALGAIASNNQSSSLDDLARRYEGYGAPSRARFEASMTPGFDPTSIPGYSGALDTASKSLMARLSATGGNPYGNPGGLIDANKQIVAGTALPAVQEYQRMNAGTGFGTTLNSAGSIGQNAIGAQGNVFNAIGAGVNDVLNPPKSLAEQVAELRRAGLFTQNSLS